MKAYRIRQFGEVEGLALGDEPDPRPGRGQVLVRVRATALNFRDLAILKGTYRGRAVPGIVPLSDGAGEVAAVGEGVSRWQKGDRVVAIFRQGWLGGAYPETAAQSDLGGNLDGMLAEEVVLSEEGLVRLPPHLSFEEAATLPCAAVTAWNALTGATPLLAGETVLVLGSGGVSVFAAQFAKLFGARVIATSSSDEKLERYRALGADETINYRTHPDWEQEVLRRTGGRGVDLVIEVGGPGTFAKSFQAARMDGRISVIGVVAGAAQIDPGPILGRRLTLRGFSVGSREMFEAMNRAIAPHRLRPVIDRVFPFAEVRDAYRYLASQRHFGKVVIRL